MNPWAFIAIALGVILIIIGIKGTQHDVASALVGHSTAGQQAAANNTTTTSTSGQTLQGTVAV